MITLGRLIQAGETQFIEAGLCFGQGTQNAWDEARWLALAALELPVDSAQSVESRSLSTAEQRHVQALFDRRITTRQPAAYLTGTAWLKGYAFRVDSRVIVPRSFLAELILTRFVPWLNPDWPVTRILDLCTGSGCLAIIAAQAWPAAQLVASDISPEALEVARLNVADYGLANRIELVESDLFARIAPQRFDLILCNPPYVPEHKRKGLPAEFRHEPDQALFAGDHGMSLVRQVLQQAPDYIAPRGLLALEIGREARHAKKLLRAEFPQLKPAWVQTAEQRDNVFLVQPHS